MSMKVPDQRKRMPLEHPAPVRRRPQQANGRKYLKRFYLPAALIALFVAVVLLAGAPRNASAQTTPVLKTQVGFILDRSGSIGSYNWGTIRTGLANALNDPLCVPQDGSVEFTLTTFSSNATVNIAPMVLTPSTIGGVVTTVQSLPFTGGVTNISDGLRVTTNALSTSVNFDPAHKQAVNLVTDGIPYGGGVVNATCPMGNNYANPECWRNNMLSTLGMDNDVNDELDSEFIGSIGTASNWLKNSIVYPQPGSYANLGTNTFEPGWVLVVPNAAGFSNAVCQKFAEIVEPAGSITKTPNPSTLPAPGGSVDFTVLIENEIDQAIDVTGLNDVPYGDITVVAGAITATNCAVPQTLQPSDGTAGSGADTYSCTFSANVNGAPGDYIDTVTATLESQTGNTIDIDADATVTIVNSADLSISKDDGVTHVTAGDGVNYQYSITVNNAGPSAAENATVTEDSFPAGFAMGAVSSSQGACAAFPCNLGTIAAGNSATVDVQYSVPSDTPAGFETNTVSVGSDTPDSDPSDNTADDTNEVLTSADLSISKDDGVTQVTAGDGVNYQYSITVNNAGPSAAENATVTEDSFPAGFIMGAVSSSQGACAAFPCNLGAIASGGSATITVAYTVPIETPAGFETNTVSVSGDEPDPDPSDNTADDTNEVLSPADLRIAKDDGVIQVTAGDGVTYQYTIAVNNDGPGDADNVTVTEDSFPAGFVMGAVSSSQGACAAFPCNLGAILNGGSATITVEYTVPSSTQAGLETNTVSVSSDKPDPDPSNNSDDDVNEVLTSADLRITKDDGVTQVTAGDGVVYQYTLFVNNDGPSGADNVTVTEDSFPAGFAMGAVSSSQGACVAFPCNLGTIATAGSASITVAYTVPSSTQAGFETNTVSVTSDEPDSDPSNNSDDDVNEVLTSADLRIAKDDGVTQVTAGDGVVYQYTLFVNNDGPSGADNVTVTEDSFPTGFAMGAVSSSQGACAAFPCNLGTIAAAGSASITVAYTVPSSTPAGFETNTVSVSSDDPDPDPSDNTDDDVNEVLVDINLSVVKTFDPAAVPQGTAQSFSIEISNAGPSDAVDVSVVDTVHGSLAVTAVAVTSGSGDCSASSGQAVDCTVQIPANQSVLITVSYVTAPFNYGAPQFGTDSGSEFRFVFVNGSVLEGSASGDVFLDGTAITPGDTKNDYLFDPPGADAAFLMHLSCSDPFTDGWGQTDGPSEGIDVNWQIAYFSITRYKSGEFFRNCGNVVVPFDVPNTATASGSDSSGTETVSDDATVTVEPGITLERVQTNGKRLTVRLTNFTGDSKEIVDLSLEWPDGNGNLNKIRLDDAVIWTGNAAPTSLLIDSGWTGTEADRTLHPGGEILRFDFKNKVGRTGYTIHLNFTDGTFLDISE